MNKIQHQFFDISSASLEDLIGSCRLWVVDEVPFAVEDSRDSANNIAIATAQEKDSIYNIEGKWIESLCLGKVPRSAEERAQLLYQSLEQTIEQYTFIIYDAHLLQPSDLQIMRLLPEKDIAIILAGDVSSIDIATRAYPSFCYRASFGVHPVKM